MSERYPKGYEEDDSFSEIRSKISSLKAISIDIGTEVREHNSLLDRMGVDFDSAGSFLDRSILQLKNLTKTERGRNYLLLTVLFIFVLLLFFYFIII